MNSLVLITLYSAIAVQAAWDRSSLSSVALILKDFKFHCYGTILSPRFVLTSTSCVKGVNPERLYLQVDLLRPYQDYTYRGKEYFVLDAIIFNITEHKENKTDRVIRDFALLFTHEIEFNENVKKVILSHNPRQDFYETWLPREFTVKTTSFKNTYKKSISIGISVIEKTTPNEVFIKIPEKIGTFNEGRSSTYSIILKVHVRNEKECSEKSSLCDVVLQGRGSNVGSILRGAPVFLKNGALLGIVSDFYPENDYLVYSITKVNIVKPWFYDVFNELTNKYTYCAKLSNGVCTLPHY